MTIHDGPLFDLPNDIEPQIQLRRFDPLPRHSIEVMARLDATRVSKPTGEL